MAQQRDSLRYTPQQRQAEGENELPALMRRRAINPRYYDPSPELVSAVNVALMLGQPLLVTGEAGVGKTQLAYSVAWELGLYPPLVFETKSTSIARDLFYTFDMLRRFHAAQTREGSNRNLDYITYNPLGTAILRSYPEEKIKEEKINGRLPDAFKHDGQRRSVVLIDEIDKAPRDFPNDLLNEIEHLYFKVPELENHEFRVGVAGAGDEARELRPVVIITSNSEKHLPDPFLRRCIYYNIEFPKTQKLEKIVTSRIDNIAGSTMVSDALEIFSELRDSERLDKKPATAELINWLTYLRERVSAGTSLRGFEEELSASLCALVKSRNDQELANELLKTWLRKKPRG